MMLVMRSGVTIRAGVLFLLMLATNLAQADNNSALPPVQIMIKKLTEIESMITCSATYQQNPKAKGAVDNYIRCVDKLIQERLLNNKKIGFAVQVFVTPNDAKANDLASDYNKSKKPYGLQKTKAVSIPFIIPYPGGARLNDGKYYKILIVDSDKEFYSTEDDAKSILFKIIENYKSFEKPFVTEAPYMVTPADYIK